MNRPHLRCRVALFLLLCLAPVLHAEQAAPRGTVSIAAYNIENLFDVFDDPYTADEGTRVKPRKELETAAALIRKLNADLISFEEVENEQVLKAFVTELLGDMGYKYVAAAASNDGRGIRTAIASRLPIRSITSYRYLDLKIEGEDRTWKFARDLMHVQLEITSKRTLHVFVVHLKSMRDDGADKKSAKWRLAEAKMSRRIIDDVQAKEPGAWVVMMGDFNSTEESAPIRELLTEHPPEKDGKPGLPLIDLHSHIPREKDQNISYLKAPYRSRIDYILASEPLAKRVVKDSAKIVNDAGELLGGSDHAPVTAAFDVRE
jgi:endonuclease/exonuclease/phosphatase family metal-dependent hydrolase